MVNAQVAQRRQEMMEGRFEAQARAAREAQREAALAAAASRAALVAEALAQAGNEGRTDPNFPVVDSAATPRSEASDGDEDGTLHRSTSLGRSPTSAGAGVTPGLRRSGSGPSSPTAALAPGARTRKKGGKDSSAMDVMEEGDLAPGGRTRKKGGRDSSAMDVMEEGEGEVAGDEAEGGQGGAPGASAIGGGGRKKNTAASMAGSVLSLTAANMKNTAASMKNTAAMAGSVLSQARRRQSSVTQEANTTQTKTSGAADLFTEQERQDAKLWVVQAKKLEEALGPCIKKLDKLKAAAKREKVQATKEIKTLEKLVTAAAQKDAKAPGLSKREAVEKMALEELKVDDCDLRIEAAESRANHYTSVLAVVTKLREWLDPKLMLVAESMTDTQLVRSRVHELSSIVSAEWKEMGSPSSQGLVIKIHGTSALEPDVHLVHPAILVSVIDEEREPSAHGANSKKVRMPGNFLLKQDEFGIAVQQNEGLSRLLSDDDKGMGGSNTKDAGRPLVYTVDPRGCPHILPVLTRPCPLLSLAMEAAAAEGSRDGKGSVKSIQAGVAPKWEEEIAYAQPPEHMLQDKVVYFFELVDFQVTNSSSSDFDQNPSAYTRQGSAPFNPWRRIAWGFYRPNNPKANPDGSAAGSALVRSRANSTLGILSRGFSWRGTRVAPGPANSYVLSGGPGRKAVLQLYRYSTSSFWRGGGGGVGEDGGGSNLGACCVALESWHRFCKDPGSYPLYPATLSVTIEERLRPNAETVPRKFGIDRCRLRAVKGGAHGDALTVIVSMTFREALSSREFVRVLPAPYGGWRPRRTSSVAGLLVTNVVPAGAIMKAYADADAQGVMLELATGMAAHASLTVTLRLGDVSDRVSWHAVYGEGGGWIEVQADVVRTRPLAPWQFEKEVPPPGELDSVALLRAVGAKNKAVSDAAANEMSESVGALREERRHDGGAGWCRVPNAVKHSMPAFKHGCSCLAFSACGRWLAAAMYSQPTVRARALCVIQVFDVSSGQQRAELKGHLDLIYDLQWVPAPQRKAVGVQRMGEGDSDGRDVPALLSCSEDFTARAWQLSVDTQDKMTGTQVSCAFHPSYCYCASWLRNPAKSAGMSAADAKMHFAMSGDASSARVLAQALEAEKLQLSSHIVTGCYDHAIRLWQACDAQRVQPVASKATACMPYTAELRYPSAGLDGVLLVLLYPRVPVAANTSITLILERFSLLPALEREAKARARKEEAGAGGGSADKGGKDLEEAISKKAITSLNPLHCKYDVNDEWCDGEASDTDKAVSVVAKAIECGVMMTLTPAVDVTSDDAWVILVPEALELVLPWDREEDQALADIMQRHTQPPHPEDAGGAGGNGGDEGGGEKGEGGGGAARREVEWKKVAAEWLQPRPDASLPAPRSDLELKERWHYIQTSAGVILEDDKIYECPAWLPLPSPTTAIADLVWDLQIASADAGNVPKVAINSRDDLLLSFSLRTDVLAGDVLALVLPGVLNGPSYLGKTLSDNSGASWVVYSNMAGAPSHSDLPRCGFTPLSLCVPEGAAAGKDSAILLVQAELSFRKGTAMKMNLSQLFGCGLAEAGLRLLPAGPLGAGKSEPVKACVQRLLSMRLGLALSPTRHLQAGDEIAFRLGALASLPDNQGVLCVPNFPHDAVQNSLEVLDLAETSKMSGGRGGKRWSSARIMVEAEGSAHKPSGGGAGANGARGNGGEGRGVDADVLIQCKAAVPIPPSAVILLTLSRLNGSANLPAVLLLHQGPGIAEVKGRARDVDEEDEAVTWPLVPGRIQGKAWWSSAQLLQKIARHQGFVNSLAVLPGADPVTPARIFSADARGVVRAWTVQADKEGLVSLVPGKSLDLVTMESADADKETGNTKGGKKPLPALKNAPGVGTGDKENVDTQNLMRKALAKLAPHTNEQHSRRSVVCLRAHDAGESSRIAALSVDSLIRVLEATTLKVLFSLSGALCRGPNACMKCSFSPDGRLVASGSEDGRLVVWQLPPPGGLASLSQLQAATYANTSGPQICTVIQPRYQGKGECTGVIWSPTRRDMAVCCIGSPAPLLILTYNPALEALSLEKACDLVSDALDGRWSHLADHMKGSWEEGVTWDTLRHIIQLVQQDVGATVTEELESALRTVFEALSGTVAGRGGDGGGGGGAVQGRQAGLGSPVKGSQGARARGGEGGGMVSMKTFVKGLSPKQWAILATEALESDTRTDRTKRRA